MTYHLLNFINSIQAIPHTRLTAFFPGLPGWAGTRNVKPIWILLKQETVSGSGISWAICKSTPRSRQITMPAPHHSVFYRPDALPATQPTASKHWRPLKSYCANNLLHGWQSSSSMWRGRSMQNGLGTSQWPLTRHINRWCQKNSAILLQYMPYMFRCLFLLPV